MLIWPGKKMFKKILIANRGEIALRIIRACKDMGITSVAVFSEIDRKSPHVLHADEAYPLGGVTSTESYLRGDKIIEIALKKFGPTSLFDEKAKLGVGLTVKF